MSVRKWNTESRNRNTSRAPSSNPISQVTIAPTCCGCGRYVGWPDDDPVGRRLRPGLGDGSSAEVIGVVATSRQASLTETESSGYVFLPLSQDETGSTVSVVVRSSMGTQATADAAMDVVKRLARRSGVVAFVASVIPARRAAAIDPMAALRE